MKQWIILFFAVLGMLFLIAALPGVLPVQSEAQKIANVESNTAKTGTVTIQSIFLNNFLVALATLIPFAGWSFIGAVLWHTGLIVASYNQPYWLFTNWVVWAELTCYSFVIVQSVRIVIFYLKIKTLKRWKPVVANILVTALIVGVVLLVSAILEFMMIKG